MATSFNTQNTRSQMYLESFQQPLEIQALCQEFEASDYYCFFCAQSLTWNGYFIPRNLHNATLVFSEFLFIIKKSLTLFLTLDRWQLSSLSPPPPVWNLHKLQESLDTSSLGQQEGQTQFLCKISDPDHAPATAQTKQTTLCATLFSPESLTQ